MKGFIIKTKEHPDIRFAYNADAPLTAAAFTKMLPFSRIFLHARVSGEEIWLDNAPELDIIQENCSIYTEPGEVVIGTVNPGRNKITGCMGIFYGKGQLLDCGNIFAKVYEEDIAILKALGDSIWREGAQEILFDKPENI